MSYPWYDKAKWGSDEKAERCKYPLEPVEDEDDLDEDDGQTFTVTQPNADLRGDFTQQIKVFGVPLVATSGVPEAKLTHAAIVMAEYLDNDEDGIVDDPAVVQAMLNNKALLVIFKNDSQAEKTFDKDPSWLNKYWVQDLYATETIVPG